MGQARFTEQVWRDMVTTPNRPVYALRFQPTEPKPTVLGRVTAWLLGR